MTFGSVVVVVVVVIFYDFTCTDVDRLRFISPIGALVFRTGAIDHPHRERKTYSLATDRVGI